MKQYQEVVKERHPGTWRTYTSIIRRVSPRPEEMFDDLILRAKEIYPNPNSIGVIRKSLRLWCEVKGKDCSTRKLRKEYNFNEKSVLTMWDEMTIRQRQTAAIQAARFHGISCHKILHLKLTDLLPESRVLDQWRKLRVKFHDLAESEFSSSSTRKVSKEGGVWFKRLDRVKRFPSIKRGWAQNNLLFVSFKTGKTLSVSTIKNIYKKNTGEKNER